MGRDPNQSKYRPVMKAFALMTTISSYLIGAVLFGVFGGMWLDRYFDSSGLFTAAGVLLGVGMAFYGIYRAVQSFMEEQDG
ncbi:AtpZ/AtpI family protein [Alkalicoccus chagannorensis]|uniref:AtpZ/AtpI family protein n=1 Tax=Alkalicoccus chagannorensis TaxID=427072 RepID=UPI000427AFBC|nr:AtpZ/AtpI family protein [Alkalicoccus chagannorensis]